MKNVHVIDHPLMRHKLGYLRDERTLPKEFREIVSEISKILAFEAMRDWKHFDRPEIKTPIAKTRIERIVDPPIVIPILRAGNGMLDGVLNMLPFASVGFIGIYRDPFIHSTVEYYFKLPAEREGKRVILCDPLIATGETIIAAIERLKSYEVGPIKILCLLISEASAKKITQLFDDVEILCIGIEKRVNEAGYLVPGLGDAGDRLFQTK
jgi:uracil phosphoribosyltransferase